MRTIFIKHLINMATVVSQFENVLSQLQQQASPVAVAPPRPVPAMSKSQTVVTTQKTVKFFQQNKGIIILAVLLVVAIVIWGVRAYLLKKAKAKEAESSEEGEEGADEEFATFFKDKKPSPMSSGPSAPSPATPAPVAPRPPMGPTQVPLPPRTFVTPAAPGQQVQAAPPSRPVQPAAAPPPQQQPFDAVIKLDSSSSIPIGTGVAAKPMAAGESEERPGGKRGEKESAIPGSDVGGTPKPPPSHTAHGGGPAAGPPPTAAAADPQFTPL
jgi:hypothetical protein